MWNYEKRLEYPINIKRTDAAMAKAIISQFGGPDGETGAAMRYLSQRFAMPYRPVMGVLTDVGIEASNSDLPQPKHSPRRLSSGASLLPAANSYFTVLQATNSTPLPARFSLMTSPIFTGAFTSIS